eukprot:15340724-Ditylum_brightwellii.AAC.1
MKALNEFGLFSIDKDSHELEKEYGLVGAAEGNQFQHTGQLKVMSYNEAMKTPEKKEWDKAVHKEHSTFAKYTVWKAVPKHKVPKDAKIITTTWAMKPKPNGIKRARLTARGFEQQDGLHYHSHDLSAPVVNDMTIRMIMIMIIMAGWATRLLDVNGAFLNGRFQNGEKLYTPVPQGFEPFYPADVLLLFLRT